MRMSKGSHAGNGRSYCLGSFRLKSAGMLKAADKPKRAAANVNAGAEKLRLARFVHLA